MVVIVRNANLDVANRAANLDEADRIRILWVDLAINIAHAQAVTVDNNS